MKNSVLLLLIVLFVGTACTTQEPVLLYVGTYTDGDSEGIYSYQFDSESGSLIPASITPNKENPSFLTISPDKKYLYAVSEVKESPIYDGGSVIAYRIDENGELEKINQQATKGWHPCYVAVSPDGKFVVASNYSSGNLSLFRIEENGSLTPSFQQIQHTGSGALAGRQDVPHAHSAQFDVKNQFLISADLGIDRLKLYQLESESGQFVAASQESVVMNPGTGPRHFEFSPDGQFLYVMNELNSTVSVVQKNGDVFSLKETVSTLPDGYTGVNSGADIHLSLDGRFVYSSNRGHNSIAVFQRDQSNGSIKLIETEHVEGDWPRNFALSPDGKFLLVANKKSNNISIFNIDQKSGLLDFTGTSVEVPSPVCLKFFVR